MELFDPAAARLIERASDEARSYGHAYIGIEHLLLALAAESSSEEADALAAMNLTYLHISSQVEKMFGRGEKHDLPLRQNPELKEVLKSAERLASSERTETAVAAELILVGPQHIYKAICIEDFGLRKRILRALTIEGTEQSNGVNTLLALFGDQSLETILPLSTLAAAQFLPLLRHVEQLALDEKLHPAVVYWSTGDVLKLLPEGRCYGRLVANSRVVSVCSGLEQRAPDEFIFLIESTRLCVVIYGQQSETEAKSTQYRCFGSTDPATVREFLLCLLPRLKSTDVKKAQLLEEYIVKSEARSSEPGLCELVRAAWPLASSSSSSSSSSGPRSFAWQKTDAQNFVRQNGVAEENSKKLELRSINDEIPMASGDFTEAANFALLFARLEAAAFDLPGGKIDPRCLMVGLLMEQVGVAGKILRQHGVTLRALRISSGVPPKTQILPADLECLIFDGPSRRILSQARKTSRMQGHRQVHSIHLLWAILTAGKTIARELLAFLVGDLAEVQAEVKAYMPTLRNEGYSLQLELNAQMFNTLMPGKGIISDVELTQVIPANVDGSDFSDGRMSSSSSSSSSTTDSSPSSSSLQEVEGIPLATAGKVFLCRLQEEAARFAVRKISPALMLYTIADPLFAPMCARFLQCGFRPADIADYLRKAGLNAVTNVDSTTVNESVRELDAESTSILNTSAALAGALGASEIAPEHIVLSLIDWHRRHLSVKLFPPYMVVDALEVLIYCPPSISLGENGLKLAPELLYYFRKLDPAGKASLAAAAGQALLSGRSFVDLEYLFLALAGSPKLDFISLMESYWTSKARADSLTDAIKKAIDCYTSAAPTPLPSQTAINGSVRILDLLAELAKKMAQQGTNDEPIPAEQLIVAILSERRGLVHLVLQELGLTSWKLSVELISQMSANPVYRAFYKRDLPAEIRDSKPNTFDLASIPGSAAAQAHSLSPSPPPPLPSAIDMSIFSPDALLTLGVATSFSDGGGVLPVHILEALFHSADFAALLLDSDGRKRLQKSAEKYQRQDAAPSLSKASEPSIGFLPASRDLLMAAYKVRQCLSPAQKTLTSAHIFLALLENPDEACLQLFARFRLELAAAKISALGYINRTSPD
ncbi:MAG: hypothetical protein KGS72_18515 [Cyanobacteria bacterium REEB67]|nr:hypothetical protein [Cyanobacteria bacterium REEB67]